jgi:error-prone DNA polymerase
LPSGDRRERVIQYVYERYGTLGAAMTANVITYRGRSAAREVGKVLELDATEIDRLAKLMNQFEFVDPEETIARNLRESGLDPNDVRYRRFAALWRDLQDLPRHLGQHSGGMVVCQGRLDEVVPLENASMPGRVVVQWDKDDCADLGIVKVDLLGLGMMAALEEALEIVNTATSSNAELRTQNLEPGPESSEFKVQSSKLSVKVDLAHLPPDDPEVYKLLQNADTVGVFQVESRAQMATLPRMRPEHFYDIVVEVAIIRPGPIVGNMVHPYLARRRGDQPVTYAHPLLEPVLKRTLGVPLFQEQLLRMAMVVANFSGGEAEELRRAMGFKRSVKRMQQIEARLRDGMATNGITGEAADQIVQSISSFALYGFPESHAASFALIVYASAYLKVHYPAAFYTALLNNYPMGFYHPATLVKDAQRRGVRFAPVDVQTSRWNHFVQDDGVIRLGLRTVRGLREDAGKRMEQAHGQRPKAPECQHAATPCEPWATSSGPFRSLDALVTSASLRQDEVRVLAEIGALASFGGDRRTALWQAERAGRPAGPLLMDEEQPSGPRSESVSPLPPMTLVERVRADYDGTGLTIGPHPMALVRSGLAARGIARAIDLGRSRSGRRVRVAGAVITRQRPGTAKGFVFLSLEDETGIANIIVTPDVFAANKRTLVDAPYLLVDGVLQHLQGSISVKADRVEALQCEGPDVPSHDFH